MLKFTMTDFIFYLCFILFFPCHSIELAKSQKVTTVKINSNKVMYRQRAVTEVQNQNWNRVCNLTPTEIKKICNECADVYASVYGNRTYMIFPETEMNVCEKRIANFGPAVKDLEVWVRECPANPTFYLSEGNKKGWVFVYTFSKVHPKTKLLEFAVHLGIFEELS